MSVSFRILMAVALSASMVQVAYAAPAGETAMLKEAQRSLEVMRNIYAAVVAREADAKASRDPIRLNRVHEISNRISDLIAVAVQTVDELRVGVASHDPAEVLEAELEKVQLILEKIRRLADESEKPTTPTDRTVTETPGGSEFDSSSWNLVPHGSENGGFAGRPLCTRKSPSPASASGIDQKSDNTGCE